MLAGKYVDMLTKKSVIRELSEYAVARGREIGYENVFDYTLGNPSVPVPESFNNSIIRLIGEKSPMDLQGYSQSLGIAEVRTAVAESLNRRFGMNYTMDHIFMTSGAAGAIAHAVRLVCEPNDEVITFAPFFPEYIPYITHAGVELKVVKPSLTDFQINFEAFEEMINERTMAVLVNTPNNPSGIVYSEATIKKLSKILLDKSREYGHIIYLISDEPYREIVFDGKSQPYPAKYYDATITCYSFSKSLSVPGERIGYVAVNPACPDACKMIVMCGQISRGIGHNCPSSIIQWAVSENLSVTADMSVYEKNMNLLYDELTNLGFEVVRPGGTFYIFPKALEEDAVAFCKKGCKYDFIGVPADSFGCPGYFRLAYCIETEKVERSLEALRRFVKENY